MKILLVWTHPSEESLCAALARKTELELLSYGHEIRVIDLYRSDFNPVFHENDCKDRTDLKYINEPQTKEHLQLLWHRELIEWAEGFVFIYPVWWWDRPALLKGWFDRLFMWGHAINITTSYHIGLLKGKRSLVIQTCRESKDNLDKQSALEAIQGVIRVGTLELCGVQVDRVQTFYNIQETDEVIHQDMETSLKEVLSLWKEV